MLYRQKLEVLTYLEAWPVQNKTTNRYTESGFITRKVVVLGVVSLVSLGLLSVSLYAHNQKLGQALQRTEITTTTSNVSEVNSESSAAIEANSQKKSSNTGSDPSVSVRINGEAIPIPDSGDINKTIPTEDGSVDLDIQGNDDENNDSQSSIDVNINSDNNSNSDTDTRTRIRIRQR
jgi:hypothetical protein